jgi:hypothetical protein
MITAWQKPVQDNASAATDYHLASDVVLVLVGDGTARLLDMSGGFFALPASGAAMVQGTLEQGSARTIEALAQRYQVSRERIEADLDTLLQQLVQMGLLRQGTVRRRKASLLPALILIPCFFLIRCLYFRHVCAALLLTLAKLSVFCFGFARTVAAWRCYLSWGSRHTGAVDEQTIRAVDQVVRRIAVGHPLPMACKERALACWAAARWAGVAATLVVGLELFPLGGHCWCEAGPYIMSDYDDNCALYTPVLRYELLS